MATLNLGRVRLNFRGDFAALNGNILEYFDAVTFRGSLYVVIAPNVTVVNDSLNWPPTVVGQQYYKKITQGINFTGQWSSVNHYFLNDLATDGDSVYIAQQTIAPSNTPPSQSTSGWSKLNGLNLFSVGADDSTLRVINGGESIVFKGGQGIDTTSDEEGNITITNSGIVDFAVTGDDSTVRLVNSGQTLQFIGGTLVTTASDANGNITIDASVAFSDLTSTPTTLAGYGITDAATSAQGILANTAIQPGDNVSELTNDSNYTTQTYVDNKISDVIAGRFKFGVAADDSSIVDISSGETVSFLGGTLVTTTSDTEGNITIDASVAFSDLTSTPTTLADYGITDAYTSAQVDTKISDVIAGRFSFSVAADDSTLVAINSGESINFLGGTLVTTTSDTEGNITIDASVAFSDLTSTPTTLAGYGITDGATQTYVDTEIANLIDSAPGTLDTLNELAAAINDDPNFAVTIAEKLNQTLYVAADDSTLRQVRQGEAISFLGGTGISTSSDTEGNITIDGLELSVGLVDASNSLLSNVTAVSAIRFDNDSGFALDNLGSGVVKVKMNSTFKTWKSDGENDLVATGLDTIQWIAGAGIDISFNPNGNPYQTITLTNTVTDYKFNVAADDSTLREITADNTVQFVGGTLVTTTSDADGNITIDASVAFSDLTSTPTTLAGYGITDAATSSQGTLADSSLQPGDNVSELVNDSNYTTQTYVDNKISDVVAGKFSLGVAADDSTIININSGESIKFIGGTNISTTSDTEGNITISSSGGGTASYASFTANENITAGQTVYLRSDDKIEGIKVASSGFGALNHQVSTGFTTSGLPSNLFVIMVHDPNANRNVVIWRDGNTGKAAVVTHTGTSISIGSVLTFRNNFIQKVTATYDSDTNQIILMYDSAGLFFQTLSVNPSTNTVSAGTAASVSIFNSYGSIVYDPSVQRFIAFYRNGSTSVDYVVGQVSGTSITLGSTATLTSGFLIYNRAVYDATAQRVVFVLTTGTWLLGAATINPSNNTATFGTITTESQPSNDHDIVYDAALGKIVFGFVKNDGLQQVKVTVLDVNPGTNAVTLNASVTLLGTGSGSVSTGALVYSPVTQKTYFSYRIDTNQYVAELSFNGSYNATITTSTTLAVNPFLQNATIVTSQDVVFIGAENFNNSVYISLIELAIQTANVDSYIGIAKDSITSGQTGEVYLLGDVADNQTNLITNQTYYLTAGGVLTTTPTTYSLVGRAVSATEILLEGDTYDRTTIDQKLTAGIFTFNVAADDSTLREITTDNTVQFIGSSGITTSSDASGNITIAASLNLNDISDVQINTATTGEVLTYNGTNWINQVAGSSGGLDPIVAAIALG